MSEPCVEATGSVLPTSKRPRLPWPSEPLPPPDLLSEYEKVVPGSAVRILELAEETTTHRIQALRKVLEHEHDLITARHRVFRTMIWLSTLVALSSLGLLILGIAFAPMPPGSAFVLGGMAAAGLLIALALGSFAMFAAKREFSSRDLYEHPTATDSFLSNREEQCFSESFSQSPL